MMTIARSWIKENSTLIYFLIGQLVVIISAGAGFLSYMVKLETRVSTMETRGAAFTVGRMDSFDKRITVLEGVIKGNTDSINTIREIMLRDLPKTKDGGRQ